MLDTIPRIRTLCLAIAILISMTPSFAGEVHVSWGPSETATSYTLYRGTSSGVYPLSDNVGNALDATADGLTDCTAWYFAVTASNSAGESGYSGEVSSWPRAVLTSAAPSSVERGTEVALTISGINFRIGDSLQFTNSGLQIDSASVNSCNELALTVTVASDAPTGPSDLLVTHPSGVTGVGVDLLAVLTATPPTVLSTSPQDGATDVPLTARPSIQFSEAVGGVNSSTVRLLDAQGAPVTQAIGSPNVSPQGDEVTIVPAAEFEPGATYRIHVVGGAGGVQDLDGNPMAEDFLQPNGFTTAGDETAPELSAIDATDIDGTSATIVWTTDEPADSTVYYRKAGAQNYQTVSDGVMTTDHSMLLTGLSPETSYQFHVESADAAGNSTTSTPDDSFTTTTSPFAYLRIEAESGILESPVGTDSGSAAFDGEWIDTPAGTSQGTTGNPSGTATFGVMVPETGTWFLWVRMYGFGGSTNSWFESIDGSQRKTMQVDEYDSWQWVAGSDYPLAEGLHSIELGGREAEARADRILLTNDPDFVPTEAPDADVIAPGTPADFVAESGTTEIDLSWTNPGDGDLATIVIRYRTDGQHPTNPVDGFALFEESATPGAAGAYTHAGLESGIGYYYSVFAIDESGNVSTPALAQGAVAGAPSPPQNLVVE